MFNFFHEISIPEADTISLHKHLIRIAEVLDIAPKDY